MPSLLLPNAFMLTNVNYTSRPIKVQTNASLFCLTVISLFQCSSCFKALWIWGCLIHSQREKMEASKIFAHLRRKEEEKEEWLSNNSY